MNCLFVFPVVLFRGSNRRYWEYFSLSRLLDLILGEMLPKQVLPARTMGKFRIWWEKTQSTASGFTNSSIDGNGRTKHQIPRVATWPMIVRKWRTWGDSIGRKGLLVVSPLSWSWTLTSFGGRGTNHHQKSFTKERPVKQIVKRRSGVNVDHRTWLGKDCRPCYLWLRGKWKSEWARQTSLLWERECQGLNSFRAAVLAWPRSHPRGPMEK